eukprot:g888.t1
MRRATPSPLHYQVLANTSRNASRRYSSHLQRNARNVRHRHLPVKGWQNQRRHFASAEVQPTTTVANQSQGRYPEGQRQQPGSISDIVQQLETAVASRDVSTLFLLRSYLASVPSNATTLPIPSSQESQVLTNAFSFILETQNSIATRDEGLKLLLTSPFALQTVSVSLLLNILRIRGNLAANTTDAINSSTTSYRPLALEIMQRHPQELDISAMQSHDYTLVLQALRNNHSQDGPPMLTSSRANKTQNESQTQEQISHESLQLLQGLRDRGLVPELTFYTQCIENLCGATMETLQRGSANQNASSVEEGFKLALTLLSDATSPETCQIALNQDGTKAQPYAPLARIPVDEHVGQHDDDMRSSALLNSQNECWAESDQRLFFVATPAMYHVLSQLQLYHQRHTVAKKEKSSPANPNDLQSLLQFLPRELTRVYGLNPHASLTATLTLAAVHGWGQAGLALTEKADEVALSMADYTAVVLGLKHEVEGLLKSGHSISNKEEKATISKLVDSALSWVEKARRKEASSLAVENAGFVLRGLQRDLANTLDEKFIVDELACIEGLVSDTAQTHLVSGEGSSSTMFIATPSRVCPDVVAVTSILERSAKLLRQNKKTHKAKSSNSRSTASTLESNTTLWKLIDSLAVIDGDTEDGKNSRGTFPLESAVPGGRIEPGARFRLLESAIDVCLNTSSPKFSLALELFRRVQLESSHSSSITLQQRQGLEKLLLNSLNQHVNQIVRKVRDAKSTGTQSVALVLENLPSSKVSSDELIKLQGQCREIQKVARFLLQALRSNSHNYRQGQGQQRRGEHNSNYTNRRNQVQAFCLNLQCAALLGSHYEIVQTLVNDDIDGLIANAIAGNGDSNFANALNIALPVLVNQTQHQHTSFLASIASKLNAEHQEQTQKHKQKMLGKQNGGNEEPTDSKNKAQLLPKTFLTQLDDGVRYHLGKALEMKDEPRQALQILNMDSHKASGGKTKSYRGNGGDRNNDAEASADSVDDESANENGGMGGLTSVHYLVEQGQTKKAVKKFSGIVAKLGGGRGGGGGGRKMMKSSVGSASLHGAFGELMDHLFRKEQESATLKDGVDLRELINDVMACGEKIGTSSAMLERYFVDQQREEGGGIMGTGSEGGIQTPKLTSSRLNALLAYASREAFMTRSTSALHRATKTYNDLASNYGSVEKIKITSDNENGTSSSGNAIVHGMSSLEASITYLDACRRLGHFSNAQAPGFAAIMANGGGGVTTPTGNR